MKFRVTVRGDNVELRGWITGSSDVEAMERLSRLGADLEPYGVVVASIADPDYNPFAGEVES